MSGYIGARVPVSTAGAEKKKVYHISGTTSTLASGIAVGGLTHVFHNGVRLLEGTDYSIANGLIYLTTAALAGDQIAVITYATITPVQNSVTGNLTVTGDVNFDGMLNNDDSIDTDVTVASGRNAAVIGPVTVNGNVTVHGTLTVI